MKHERQALLHTLESVAPGLANREALEQSGCFVFRDGHVWTFNDEVCCRAPLESDITGAVAAKPLLELLRKLTESVLDLAPNDESRTQLRVRGKRRRAGITMEAAVQLPIDQVEQPAEDAYKDLAPNFCDALAVVQGCASKDPQAFELTCLHITPTYMEACDNHQLARYEIKTPIKEPVLVKRDSLKHLVGLGVTEVAATLSWLHFRAPSGLVVSCRREIGEYCRLDDILAAEGEAMTLPGALGDVIERAEIFSGESTEENAVVVTLTKGEFRLKGIGNSGFYEERKAASWDGPEVSFLIGPKMLVELSEKSADCLVGEGTLSVDSGQFRYVTVLGEPAG